MLVINKRIQFCGEQKLFNYKLVIHTKQVGYFSPCIFDGHAKNECKWLKYMGLNKERLLTGHSYGVFISVKECCTSWPNDFGVTK